MEPLMDVPAASRFLSVSPYTVRFWLRTGRLTAVRLGRRVLFEPCELQRFCAEQTREYLARHARQPRTKEGTTQEVALA